MKLTRTEKCYSISVCPYISSGGSRIFKKGGIKEWMLVGVVSGECLEE